MGKQVYYEDLNPGDLIPTLTKHILSRHLVMWCGANNDFQEIHYDKDFALSKGLSGPIVQGDLSLSYLTQMLTDWVGEDGDLKKIKTMNKRMLTPGQDVICKGRVIKKYIENGQNMVSCEIWLENKTGEKIITGEAQVSLPVRG